MYLPPEFIPYRNGIAYTFMKKNNMRLLFIFGERNKPWRSKSAAWICQLRERGTRGLAVPCRQTVRFCSGRFLRALFDPMRSCAYGDLHAKALLSGRSRSWHIAQRILARAAEQNAQPAGMGQSPPRAPLPQRKVPDQIYGATS